MANNNLLQLKEIHKQYQSPSNEQTRKILNGINLDVAAGETVAIIGPSGSGKSTLLNIIGALDRPSSGEIFLDGKDLSALSDNKLANLRNSDIGFIFQLHHLLPQCTVLENVLIPTIPDQTDKNGKATDRGKRLLKRVGLEDHMDHRPGQLSGGECQRTAVVRALINSPKLILADEPTGSLDEISSENLGQLLMELNQEENMTFITVTHSAELAKKMKKIYRLHDGLLEKKQ